MEVHLRHLDAVRDAELWLGTLLDDARPEPWLSLRLHPERFKGARRFESLEVHVDRALLGAACFLGELGQASLWRSLLRRYNQLPIRV